MMFAILRLSKEAYGVPVSREIELQSGRSVALSGVYAALERLERNGLVTAELGETTPNDAGVPRLTFV